jgi:hypothetical protein
MAFSPDNFWHNANKKLGFAKSNRFIVNIQIPSVIGFDNETTRSLELQCESAELPGKNLVTQDVKVYGPTYKMATHKQYANEITLNFLCTNTGMERSVFDDWIEYINPRRTNNMRYPGGTNGIDGRYLSMITITQYNDFVNNFNYNSQQNFSEQIGKINQGRNIAKITEVSLLNSFPIGYAAQPLNWGDDGFQRLSVQFAYNGFINNPIQGLNNDQHSGNDSEDLTNEQDVTTPSGVVFGFYNF